MNLFHHSSAFIAKHKHHHHLALATLALVIAGASVYTYRNQLAQAATYTWTQTSWAGGVTSTNATHALNGDIASPPAPWTKYVSSTTGILANASGVALTSSSKTAVDDDAALSAKVDYATQAEAFDTAVSPDGAFLYVANFNGNSVSRFVRNPVDGTLSARIDYPTATRPGAVVVSPDGNSVYTISNASNVISMLPRNPSTGALSTKTDYSTGTGPYKIAISPDGVSVYVTNNTANTVSMFNRNISTGVLSAKTDYGTQSGPTGVTVSPNGGSVYVTNTTTGSVSMYTRTPATGVLSAKTDYATGGTSSNPYGVVVSPDGAFVYVVNYWSASISVFPRNLSTGALSGKTDYSLIDIVTYPSWIAISPDGGNVYITGGGSYTGLTQAQRNITTGALSGYKANAGLQYIYSVSISPDGSSVYTGTSGYFVSLFQRNIKGGARGFGNGARSATSLSNSGGVQLSRGALSSKTDYTTGTNPYSIAVSSEGNSVYTNNNGATTVSMLPRNPSTGVLSAKTDYTTGSNSNGDLMAISPDGVHVYVANNGSNTVSMYTRNTSTGTLSAKTDYASGTQPTGVAVSPDGLNVYVTHGWAGTATIARFTRNPTDGTLSARVDYTMTGKSPWGVIVSPDGNSVYTANNPYNTVSRFVRDPATGNLSGEIEYATGSLPFGIAISPDGTSLYVTNSRGNGGGNTVSRFIRNTSTGVLSGRTDYLTEGTSPYWPVVSPDGANVYVANYTTNTVTAFMRDTSNGTLYGKSIHSAGTSPLSVAISANGASLYVANYGANTVSAFTRSTAGYTTGTFTSAIIDTGASSDFTTLSWTETLNGQTITMKARSSNSSTMSGATAFASCTNITQGASLSTGGCITNGHRYVQYEATLTSSNNTITPTLDSVTIGYTQYTLSGNIVSSRFDSADSTNIPGGFSWTASGTSGTETVAMQIRTSADNTTWTRWCGSTLCNDVDTFTTTPVTVASGHPVRSDGVADRYIQYRLLLGSGGVATPTVTQVVVTYVQNGAPTVTNLNTISQASDGTVTVTYDSADDTNTTLVMTLQYCSTNCTGGSEVWVDATAVTGDVGAGVAVGSGKSIVWTPATDYSGQFKNGTQKARVKAYDGEGANHTGYSSTSNTFTLDTTVPAITTARLDSSGTQDTIALTTTDSSTIQYRLCNNNAFTSPDAQGNSCAWTTLAVSPITSSAISWTAVGSPTTADAETVYLEVRDEKGNVTARTLIAPATPQSIIIADTSNPAAHSYGENLSWIPDPSFDPATWHYDIYVGTSEPGATWTSGITYTLLASPTTNVYSHNICPSYSGCLANPSATSSAYWYKVNAVNGNGDKSNFNAEFTNLVNGIGVGTSAGDVPDSFGTAAADTDAPTVTLLTATDIKNTSAKITFTTDELAISQVYYGPSSCSTATPVTTSYVISHSTYITGLTKETPYYYCVKVTDVLGNVSSIIPGSVTTFTTAGGPLITNVTEREITDTSALIFWNTSTSSTSYVRYATERALVSGATPVGSATMVPVSSETIEALQHVHQHQVGLTGLEPGETYYFRVESTDYDSNTTISDNSGQYYEFVTLSDTSAPTISNIATPVISSEATVIVWMTDEPATSKVLYGPTAGNRPKHTTKDTTKSIYHVQTLSSATLNAAGGNDITISNNALTPSTPYYYVVESEDMAGNVATSDEQTVTTNATGNVTVIAVRVSAPATTGDTTKDTTPPTISDIAVSEITPFGATVTFTTSEDSVSFVDYGKDLNYGDSAGNKTHSKTHTIKLRGLTLGSEYHIKVSAVDKSGNTGTSADQTFKTTFLSENLSDMANVENIEQFQKEIESAIESILPSLVPPFVTKPQATDITENEATITFKTNIKAFPIVGYVEQGAYDETSTEPYKGGEVSDVETKATDHSLVLTGLKSNTKYHYQARAFSLPKVIGKSTDLTFTTKAAKIAGSIVERKKDSFTVVWVTDQPTTSIVEFKNLKSGVTERKTDDAMRTSHSMKVENLPSGTLYSVNISGINEEGNVVEAGSPISVTTSTDTTPPVISGFKVDNALVPGRTDRIQTIVSWTTDEPGNATVYYEEGAGTAGDTTELANKNEVLDSYVMNHSVILPNLKPGTIYRLKVVSSDDSGNDGSFGPRTVITPRQTESITDIIFKNFEDSFKFLRKI